MQKIKVKGDDLSNKTIYSYGIGHFMNDLSASCWFFFLPYYLTEIKKIDPQKSGYILLAGQIADAIATPLVGIYSDKTNTKIGKRTPWYIAGTILVTVSFSLIFVNVLSKDVDDSITTTYYYCFPILFNIGWAAVQVAHMSLLPSLSLNKKIKDRMIRIRTGFTFLAQTAALLFSFFFFWLIKEKLLQYEVLAGSCMLLGVITSLTFLIVCKEADLTKNISIYRDYMRLSIQKSVSISTSIKNSETDTIVTGSNDVNGIKDEETISWTYWLKKPDFYIYILAYMLVRLCINTTQSVIPYYLEFVLGYERTADGGTPMEFSIILLISTFGSILNSIFFQTFIDRKLKKNESRRFILLLISTVFLAFGCLPMLFLEKDSRVPIYFLAFIFGIGFSQALSTVCSLINDVVGSKGCQGAFVFGSYSFADKFSCGIALAYFVPVASQRENSSVLKFFMSVFPPFSLVIALIIVFIKDRCRKRNQDVLTNSNRISDVQGEGKEKKNYKSIIDDSRFTFVDQLPSHMKKKNDFDDDSANDSGNDSDDNTRKRIRTIDEKLLVKPKNGL